MVDHSPVTVLDGGMGHLLKRQGVKILDLPFDKQFVSTAVANAVAPGLVVSAHRRYVQAGADVLTTNTFAVTRHQLAAVSREHELEALVKAAVLNAQEARSGCERHVRIAGCLPPLQECYRVPDLDRGELARQYRELAAALAGQAAGVDLLLAETLCSSKEAAAAAEAAAAVGKPLWLSFTIDDEVAASRLRGGEALGAAVAAAVAACSACGADLRAVMVNCSHPAAVGAALKQLRGLPLPEGVALGAYANGFRTTTSQWLAATGEREAAAAGDGGSGSGGTGGQQEQQVQQQEPAAAPPACSISSSSADYDSDSGIISPEAYARHAADWVREGATVVGGCCGVGPEHIAAVALAFKGGRGGTIGSSRNRLAGSSGEAD